MKWCIIYYYDKLFERSIKWFFFLSLFAILKTRLEHLYRILHEKNNCLLGRGPDVINIDRHCSVNENKQNKTIQTKDKIPKKVRQKCKNYNIQI